MAPDLSDITPVLQLPEGLFRRAVQHTALLALDVNELVTLIGASSEGVALCRCVAHPDAVLVVPDVVVAELIANGWAERATQTVEREDGRTVYLYRVPAFGL